VCLPDENGSGDEYDEEEKKEEKNTEDEAEGKDKEPKAEGSGMPEPRKRKAIIDKRPDGEVVDIKDELDTLSSLLATRSRSPVVVSSGPCSQSLSAPQPRADNKEAEAAASKMGQPQKTKANVVKRPRREVVAIRKETDITSPPPAVQSHGPVYLPSNRFDPSLRLIPRPRTQGKISEGVDEWRKMVDARAKGREEERAEGISGDAGLPVLRRSARKK